jgi:hypothetical protein
MFECCGFLQIEIICDKPVGDHCKLLSVHEASSEENILLTYHQSSPASTLLGAESFVKKSRAMR